MKKVLLGSIVLTVFAIAIGLFQISSCTKTTAQQPAKPATFPLAGLWTGTYTVNEQPGVGEQYFSFIIKPDGSIIVETKGAGQQHLSIGTWTLSDSTLNCSFISIYGLTNNVGVNQSATAVWDKTGKLNSGTWQSSPTSLGTGKFTLTRIN
jgi:hypothetical protein